MKTKDKTTEMRTALVWKKTQVFLDISPCSWMYPRYGLQFRLSLQRQAYNIGSVFVHHKNVPWDDSKDMLGQAGELATVWLKENGLRKLKAAQRKQEKWQVAVDEFQALMEAAERQDMAAAKAQGFTHKTVAWIHPEAGDDYRAELLTRQPPTAAELKKLVRKSAIKTDYKIIEL